jgi:hypothetical protein
MPMILVMFDPFDEFFGPDFARNNERNAWRIHHDLLFRNRAIALLNRHDFARARGKRPAGRKSMNGKELSKW